MSGYKSSEFLKEFISRTKTNLNIINCLVKVNEKNLSIEEREKMLEKINTSKAYEVTQRINSFFGFIILPFEKYNFDPRKKNGLCHLCSNDKEILKCVEQVKNIILNCWWDGRFYCSYNNITKPIEQYDFDHVIKIVRHLRNSIAHGGNEGIMFYPLSYNTEVDRDIGIQDIIFYDVNKHENSDYKGPDEEFCIQLNVERELDMLWSAIVNLFIRVEEIDMATKKENKTVEEMEKKIKRWKSLMSKNN